MVLYSDTGFILLGELVRRVSGEPLDRFVQKRFYTPLGMRDTRFRPASSSKPRIAPTEVISSGPLRGTVHDGNARKLDGVAGHAGLFSTADDLARLCRMLLHGGVLDGKRYLKAATVRAMFTPEVIGETTRGLGWDMASGYSRTLGSFFPVGSAGHTGFTGTSIWMDPANQDYLDHPDQPRPPLRQGQRGRAPPAGERRGRVRASRRVESPTAPPSPPMSPPRLPTTRCQSGLR